MVTATSYKTAASKEHPESCDNAIRAKNNRSPKNKVGAYIRLSRDSGGGLESDSVTNQRNLIRNFVENCNKNGTQPFSHGTKQSAQARLEIIDEFVDDGCTGTNYDRPDFQKLMEAVRAGKINCIIIKDFSRLGRNYIETGRYLEEIFPMYGVRVISILDRYDNMYGTGDADGIIVPFKNLINDAYCRDISMKIRSHLDVKRKSGQFIGSFAAYGYAKDPADKNHLVIDSYAAEIVKMIFRMRIGGYNSDTIAEHLNSLGVLPPSEYKRACGLNFDAGYRCAGEPKWTHAPVNRILRNEMYTGTMVQGVNRKPNYRVKKVLPVPKENWIKVKGTHAAIIDEKDFERVQELLLLDTRKAPGQDTVYLFSGFLRCGDCGNNMVRRHSKYKHTDKKGNEIQKTYFYYHCLSFKRRENCTSHNISEKDLTAAVLDAVREQARLVVTGERLVREIAERGLNNFSVRTLDDQIEALLAEVKRYKDLKIKLYADKLDDVVSAEEYTDLSRRFDVRAASARQKCDALVKKREKLSEAGVTLKPWMEDFKKYGDVTELSREMVVALIKDIVIFEGKGKGKKGRGERRVQVNFRHREEMEALLMLGADNPGIMEPETTVENDNAAAHEEAIE